MEVTAELKRDMFWHMLLSRRLDERAWVLHRQGKIAFHISGIGQEAAQVGAAFALRRGEDWVTPYYRDLALMLCLGYTPRDFVLSLMGKREEPNSGGRQMPSHWSLRSANAVSHSAPVATQAPHAAGIGLAIKMRKEDKVVLTTIGEGSTSQGEWYEAVNWAAIHALPVIFLVENNQYAISVPTDKQMAVKSAADKACGLGLDGRMVDGTDVFAVYAVMSEVVAKARSGGGPSLIEARMYRITPHSSDDDDRSYRTREEVEENKKRDPILVARTQLLESGVLSARELEEMESRAKAMVDDAVAYAEKAPYPAVEEAAYPVYVEEVRRA
ncbi:thiamine pyrophosphate-dependent dehydrogenase E1 component subunit alpha [Levilinea saccharolytica]|nr:thiamine pyrophosphate-dependent dehydrogenase E1 component subunit alpha [Levilinea saccharolytica]GAP16422.1 branched-chain alpha-keto acid dehydrogenase E1 component [Levilinea saccharolytica]